MQNPNQEDHNTADVFVSQPTVNAQNTLRIGQQALINRMLRVIAILGLLAFGAGVFEFVNSGQYSQLVVISVVYLVLLLITFLPGRSYSIQVGILLFLLYLIGVYSLLTSGQTGYGVPFLLTIPVLSILFFDRRVGIIISILVITTVVLFWCL